MCWNCVKHIGDILKVTPGPFPPSLCQRCHLRVADLQPLQFSIFHPDGVWRQNAAAETNCPGKEATISHKKMLEYCSKHQPTPAGVILCVQRVEEQTVHDGSLLLSWRHLQQGSGAERHAAQLVSWRPERQIKDSCLKDRNTGSNREQPQVKSHR